MPIFMNLIIIKKGTLNYGEKTSCKINSKVEDEGKEQIKK